MKNKLNKAFSHKLNVFGKAVPTFLVAAMLIGSGTAATLAVFATSTGQVSVQQAVTFGDGSGTATASYDGSEVAAGDTVMSSYALTNNADQQVSVSLHDYYKEGDGTYQDEEEGITTNFYTLETSSYSNDLEKRWGATPSTAQISDSFDVSVTHNTQNAVFDIKVPQTSNYSNDDVAVGVDFEADGEADVQIGFVDGQAQIKEATSEGWSEWKELPSGYEVTQTEDGFTVKVDVSKLGGIGSDYKFGAQTLHDSNDSRQIFVSTDADHLWYDSDTGSYTSSNYYLSETVGTTVDEGSTINLEAEGTLDYVAVTDFAINVAEGDYTIKNEVRPVME